jgi:chromosome partitioning protein
VGKTTTSVHLAAGLGRRAPTVLVDADPQASASRWAELAPDMPYQTEPADGLDFSSAGDGAEHLVIDTPPGHPEIVAAAVASVDRVIIPVEPLLMDLDRLTPTVGLMATVGADNNPSVHILLTRVRSGTRSAKSAREMLLARGLPVLDSEIPMLEAYGWGFGLVPPDGHRYGLLLDELLAGGDPADGPHAPSVASVSKLLGSESVIAAYRYAEELAASDPEEAIPPPPEPRRLPTRALTSEEVAAEAARQAEFDSVEMTLVASLKWSDRTDAEKLEVLNEFRRSLDRDPVDTLPILGAPGS